MKNTIALAAAGLIAASQAFAGTAGNTPSTGPEGTGNFVAGLAGDTPNTGPEGTGNFVSGKAGNPSAGETEIYPEKPSNGASR
jgi:hypothetical protein